MATVQDVSLRALAPHIVHAEPAGVDWTKLVHLGVVDEAREAKLTTNNMTLKCITYDGGTGILNIL